MHQTIMCFHYISTKHFLISYLIAVYNLTYICYKSIELKIRCPKKLISFKYSLILKDYLGFKINLCNIFNMHVHNIFLSEITANSHKVWYPKVHGISS